MSTNSKKKITKGKRYTDAEKQEVVSFAQKVNADNGRGGQAAAARKFGISVITVSTWLKSSATATTPAEVAKVAKVAKKSVRQGKRYSDEQKKTVIDFLIAVNAKKGRGGLSAATKKFRISPLTISDWLRKSGLVMPKPAKAAKAAKAAPVKRAVSAKVMAAISNQIAKAEKGLAKLKIMVGSLN